MDLAIKMNEQLINGTKWMNHRSIMLSGIMLNTKDNIMDDSHYMEKGKTIVTAY